MEEGESGREGGDGGKGRISGGYKKCGQGHIVCNGCVYIFLFRFFQLTRRLRDLPIEVTHEDTLIPTVCVIIDKK